MREDIKIELTTDPTLPPIIDLSLDLNNYGFPTDGEVYLEAQQSNTKFERSFLGLVSQNIVCKGKVLEKFDDAEGLSFKVKIVHGNHGLLLGIAENIKPHDTNGEPDKNHKSILPVTSVDLTSYGVLWRIQDNDDSYVLQVEIELGNKDLILRSLIFRGLILPAAMQQILTKVVSEKWDEDLSDPSDLATKWIIFATQLGAELPNDTVDKGEWVEDAVARLSSSIGVRSKFIESLDSEIWK